MPSAAGWCRDTTPLSVKIVQRAPSAKRADQVPIGTSSSRPLGFSPFTCAPSVSTWATMARSGLCSAALRCRRGWRRAGSARRGCRAASSSRPQNMDDRRRCSRSGSGSRAACRAFQQVVDVDVGRAATNPSSAAARFSGRTLHDWTSRLRPHAWTESDCGNSRSTKRSAVGCGSWLARPGPLVGLDEDVVGLGHAPAPGGRRRPPECRARAPPRSAASHQRRGAARSVTSWMVPPVCRLAVLRTGEPAPVRRTSSMRIAAGRDAALGLGVERDLALAAGRGRAPPALRLDQLARRYARRRRSTSAGRRIAAATTR